MAEYPNSQGKTQILKLNSIFAALLMSMALIAACEQENTYVEPPPPKVTIAEPLEQEVIEYLEFTGNTRAYEEAEVRARVPGFLQSMHFTPGTEVQQGDLLFVIDPREYEAELNAAKAALSSAEAQYKRAKIEFDRAESLYKQKAGAEAEVVRWRGQRDVANAAVLRAQAKVEQANLNLSYTQVTTPISGRISRNYVDIGNLVGESEPTLLTTVTRFDPMYVYFNLNENDLLRVMTMYRNRVQEKSYNPEQESDSKAEIPLYLGLANETGFPHEGIMDFAESDVDAGTGTLQLRGVFPNPSSSPILLPGLFTRLRLPIDKRDKALLVTERAIGADQSGRFILTVNSENVVEKRPIRQGQLVDGLRVIVEGLQPGELVIVNGLQRARPGGKVDPEKIEMKALTISAIRARAAAKLESAETKQESSKTASAEPAGDEKAERNKKQP